MLIGMVAFAAAALGSGAYRLVSRGGLSASDAAGAVFMAALAFVVLIASDVALSRLYSYRRLVYFAATLTVTLLAILSAPFAVGLGLAILGTLALSWLR